MRVSAQVQLMQVKEAAMDSPVFILSYPRILRYVMSHFQDAEGDDLLDQSISETSPTHHGVPEIPEIPESLSLRPLDLEFGTLTLLI